MNDTIYMDLKDRMLRVQKLDDNDDADDDDDGDDDDGDDDVDDYDTRIQAIAILLLKRNHNYQLVFI